MSQTQKFARNERQLNIRVTNQEMWKLEQYCKQKNQSKSDVLRETIQKLPPVK